MNSAIKVLLIDDHAPFRRQVCRMLLADPGFAVAGEAGSAQEGQERLAALAPDLVLLGLGPKDTGGLELLAQIKSRKPAVRCIVLADSDDTDDLLDTLRAGADGYLLKAGVAEELCSRLRKAMSGVTVLQESLKEKLVAATRHLKPRRVGKKISLTRRESEILDYLAQGHNNCAIAHALGISLNTVKVHTKNLLVKLKLANRLEVAMWAHKNRPGMSFSAQQG